MDFSGKMTAEDLMIRVLPGGFFLSVLFFVFSLNNRIADSAGKFDFLYSFLFFCLAFMVGEILQIVAHLLEFLVDVFYKGYRPSEIFLYQNNPVIGNKIISDLIDKLSLSKGDRRCLKKDYGDLPFICSKNHEGRRAVQKLFWEIFSVAEEFPAMQRSNVNYLFVRVVAVEFLLLAIILSVVSGLLSLVSFLVFFCFLWRARGVAKGLVFKAVNIYLKD
jgi:hypothetical protein